MPGIELSVKDGASGIHTLVVFGGRVDRKSGTDRLYQWISERGIRGAIELRQQQCPIEP